MKIIIRNTDAAKAATLQSRTKALAATNARWPAAQRALVADGPRKTQSRSLPSGVGSAAPAHGFTQVVAPTACRFPSPTPDRSVTETLLPKDKNNHGCIRSVWCASILVSMIYRRSARQSIARPFALLRSRLTRQLTMKTCL